MAIKAMAESAKDHLEDGIEEASRLDMDVQTDGAAGTARAEIAREREYVNGAESTFGRVLRAGQSGGNLVGVMLTITIAAAVGFVGTVVISELDDSIETSNGTHYDNASDDIASGFSDAMGLSDIVFLVLMFGVVLAALLGFRGRR
jgi:hypothetical protein